MRRKYNSSHLSYLNHKNKKGEKFLDYMYFKEDILINTEITNEEVLVVGNDGEQFGKMNIKDANNLALENDLDLVLVSPNSNPPVCKIMDYNKYKFEKIKKEKENKKKQKTVITKEIQLSTNIDKHDMEIKAKNAIKFLNQGNKVDVRLRLRGREKIFENLAINTATKFADMCKEFGQLSKPIKCENYNIVFTIIPIKQERR